MECSISLLSNTCFFLVRCNIAYLRLCWSCYGRITHPPRDGRNDAMDDPFSLKLPAKKRDQPRDLRKEWVHRLLKQVGKGKNINPPLSLLARANIPRYFRPKGKASSKPVRTDSAPSPLFASRRKGKSFWKVSGSAENDEKGVLHDTYRETCEETRWEHQNMLLLIRGGNRLSSKKRKNIASPLFLFSPFSASSIFCGRNNVA